MTLEEKLWKSFNKALGQYQLIDEGDRILVGLSGGKDSLLLTEFLARRQRIFKPYFTVEALHVRMENVRYESDTSYLECFCQELNVPLHIVTTSFPTANGTSATSFGEKDISHSSFPIAHSKHKPPCFLCSWQRRKMLFNIAQKHGCTKIALGHHQDDIIHTALMNLCFQGQFTTMPAKLRMKKMPLTIIRPLCLCQEMDIRYYAEARNYQKQVIRCPHENDTNRHAVSDLFNRFEQLNPEARYSIFHALENSNKLTEY